MSKVAAGHIGKGDPLRGSLVFTWKAEGQSEQI